MTPGMPLSPQLLAQMLQATRKQPAMPVVGVPPGDSKSVMPQLSSTTQTPTIGDNNQLLPSGNVAPMVPGIPMSATPPREGKKMSASGVAAIPAAVFAVKQQMTQGKMQKARELTGQYLAMKASPDPKIQEMANKLLADPKNHKIFDKAVSDPSSPEYQGVQAAYRDQVGQEQMAAKYQEMQQKLADMAALETQRRSVATREQALAGKETKQTEQMGQVTPAMQAQLDAKGKIATDQIKARLQMTDKTTAAMLEAVKMRTETQLKVAKIHEAGAKAREATKADTYIIQEYKVIGQQLSELDKQSKDLQTHLDKNTHWYGDADDKDEVTAQLNQIEAQRQILGQQLQLLQSKDQAFQRSGLVKRPEPPTPSGDGSSADKAIVIK